MYIHYIINKYVLKYINIFSSGESLNVTLHVNDRVTMVTMGIL